MRRGRSAQPVILVTAYGSPEVVREMREAGVADCFPKPFPMDVLVRSVRRALEVAAQSRRPQRRKSA